MVSFELVEIGLEDASDIQKHADNENVSRYLVKNFPFPYTQKDAEDFITMIMKHYVENNNQNRQLGIKINNEIVGMMGYVQGSNSRDHIANIGYWLSEDYWGEGITSSALKETCDFIFRNTKVIRIEGDAFIDNIGSIKVMEKVGFKTESILKSGMNKHGKYYDTPLLVLFKDDFYSR